jgi:hypothetical protein
MIQLQLNVSDWSKWFVISSNSLLIRCPSFMGRVENK